MTCFSRRAAAIAVLVVGMSCGLATAQDSRHNFYTPAPLDTLQPVAAKHGMVVAQEKLAAHIGADILARGGNAVDAAVATAFAMAVTYPRAGNLGGGGFMVIHLVAPNRNVAIDYRETAPAATTSAIFLGDDGKPNPAKSRDQALGIGVPGTVAGLALALDKYGSGKFKLADILQPAITLARNGFTIADDSADTLPDWYRRLAKWPSSAKIFSRPDGTSLQQGDTLVQPDLEATLEALAARGVDGFYDGPVAEKLIDAIRNAGGIMTREDLKNYRPVIREPVLGTYRGYDIVSMPLPSSGGIVLVESLNILEGFNLAAMGEGSVDALHLTIEAMKRGYADRAHYLGDPDFVSAPAKQLVSKDYAARQRASIDINKATPWTDILATGPPHEGSNTTHFSVVDKDGNSGQQYLHAQFQLRPWSGRGRHRRSLEQRARRLHCGPGCCERLRPRRVRCKPAGSEQASAVVDDANHRAEGRQGRSGDRLARRQPHHLNRVTGSAQCARLSNEHRSGCGRPAAASAVDAG